MRLPPSGLALESEIKLLTDKIEATRQHALDCCDGEMMLELTDRLKSLEGVPKERSTCRSTLNLFEIELAMAKAHTLEDQHNLDLQKPFRETPEGGEPANQSDNNGGKTSYYDLPPASDRPCLDDLIEYKDMRRWRSEMFKTLYALEGRADKAEDGSSSELRELHKMAYYLNRRLSQLKEPTYIVEGD